MNNHGGYRTNLASFVRNVWYCAAWSDELTDRLLGRKILNEVQAEENDTVFDNEEDSTIVAAIQAMMPDAERLGLTPMPFLSTDVSSVRVARIIDRLLADEATSGKQT